MCDIDTAVSAGWERVKMARHVNERYQLADDETRTPLPRDLNTHFITKCTLDGGAGASVWIRIRMAPVLST